MPTPNTPDDETQRAVAVEDTQNKSHVDGCYWCLIGAFLLLLFIGWTVFQNINNYFYKNADIYHKYELLNLTEYDPELKPIALSAIKKPNATNSDLNAAKNEIIQKKMIRADERRKSFVDRQIAS